RCIRQANNGATTAPRIEGTFTNYYNTIRFPDVDRAMYGVDATAWNELKVTDDLTGCTSCYIEYRIHNKAGGAVLAGPFTRTAGQSGMATFPISGVGVSEIYVSARVYRTGNTPIVQSLWLTATEPSPLPVTMSEMNASCDNNVVQLNWTTASENNTDYFAVEKSSDMITWQVVQNVTAVGFSSTLNHYSVLDERPLTDINYYRISSVDFDGFTQTYNPLSVKCDFTGDLQITAYPNPFVDEILISTYSDVTLSDVAIELYDVTGRIVYSQTTTIPIGNSTFLLNSDLKSAGLYFLTIKSSDKHLQSIKLIK
ncbi:MAG TPA: T9SS type A sorting domain-containing protein, partial [Crocinitomicaceae bacterium]|nr:T9SS type A sorting domain-containing protein [Crocinitomicaceae bacterium]